MNNRFVFAGILSLAIFAAGFTGVARADEKGVETMRPAAPAINYTQLAAALEKSGLSYQKIKDGAWTLPVETKDGKKYNLNIAANQDILSFYAVVAEIKGEPAAGLDKKLAELNEAYYLIKFLYNKNGMYFRIDALLDGISPDSILKYVFVMNAVIEKELKDLQGFIPQSSKDDAPPPPKKGQK